jgi:glucose-6-phosphate 1-epimerase
LPRHTPSHHHNPTPFKPSPLDNSGGIPVCFPQFGQLGPLGQHGFARNSAFSVVEEEEPSSAAVALALTATGEEDARFPHPFHLRVRTSLSPDGNTLRQDLTVKNTGNAPFDFTAALHTYFAVPDVAELSVEGLDASTYSDSLDGGKERPQIGPVIFDQEVDRIYLNAPDSGIIAKNAVAKGAKVEVRKGGFKDAVVWNPWVEKAAAMADFGDDEFQRMLCIEPAVAKSGAVTVEKGEEWGGWQELVYTPAP